MNRLVKPLGDVEGFEFELGLTEDESAVCTCRQSIRLGKPILLGLGLVQTELDKEKGEIGEAVDDLQDICQLGYDEEDDEEELAGSLRRNY